MKAFFTRLYSLLRTFTPFVVVCLIVSNFCLSCAAFRSAHPRYLYHHVVVTNETVQVISNALVSTSDHLVKKSEKEVGKNTLPEISRPYEFFLLGGSAMAKIDGFYYRSGDVLSSGTIIRIFPDCIFLHDGTKIVNSRSFSKPRKEEILNE